MSAEKISAFLVGEAIAGVCFAKGFATNITERKGENEKRRKENRGRRGRRRIEAAEEMGVPFFPEEGVVVFATGAAAFFALQIKRSHPSVEKGKKEKEGKGKRTRKRRRRTALCPFLCPLGRQSP